MIFMVRIFFPALLLFIMAACGSESRSAHTDGDLDFSESDTETSDGDGENTELPENESDGDFVIGAELDIFPYVSLYASRTLTDVLPWPRESSDAVATLRDDDYNTTWKAPGGDTSYIDMDIMPWIGHAVGLYRLELELAPLEEGGSAPAVKALFYNACGGRVLHELDYENLSAPLELADYRAGCLRLQFSPATESAFEVRRIRLASRDASIALPDVKPAAQTVRHERSGVIEGFYGVPWSWEERRRMLDTLAAQGMGAYLYCPKDDELHRARWREVYPQEFMERFAALNEYASARGQTLYFGLSPFIDYKFDEDDYTALEGKLSAFTDMGVKGVAILADDIEFDIEETVDGELGSRHATVVNRLLGGLRESAPDLHLLFVPTVYSDERANDWPGGQEYLEALNELDASVSVMWTGPATSNASMQAADLQRFTAAVGRAPLIWDNYYANDGGDGFTGRILLAPFDGRNADLPQAVEGIMHNPMIQGGLARLALGGFAYWLDNPQASGAQYDDAKRSQAVFMELKHAYGAAYDETRATDALELFMRTWNGHAQRFPSFEQLDELIAALKQKINAGTLEPDDARVRELLEIFARLYVIDNTVYHSGLSHDIVDEMYWPTCAMRFVGEQGLYTMRALGARLAASDDASSHLTAARSSQSEAGRCRFQFERNAVDALTDTVEKMNSADSGFDAPAVPDDDIACIAGTEWLSEKSAGDIDNIIIGLPGADIVDGRVVFDPPYAGSFTRVRLLFGDKGWNFKTGSLLCDTP